MSTLPALLYAYLNLLNSPQQSISVIYYEICTVYSASLGQIVKLEPKSSMCYREDTQY